MAIRFHEAAKEFHLYNEKISYIIKVLENGQLGHVYYGKHLTDREDFGYLIEYARRDMAPYPFEGRSDFSLEHLKQEYPTFGSGDTRYPAFELESADGSRVVDFKYKTHEIFAGKKALEGLPAVYVEDNEEADTLEIVLEDEMIQTKMILSYTIFRDRPVITRHVRFECECEAGITLLNCMSGCLDLPDKEYEMVELAGAWNRERHPHTRKLTYGVQSIYSMRGCSSHQFNPFLMLKRANADECSGEVLGFSLVYSGDFLAQAEVDNFDVTRVVMGIHPNEFRWELKKGEHFQTPEMVMVYSENGMNGMSQVYHELYRTRLARGTWRDKVRPILINNWEATYFDFNEEKILDIAEKAKEIGVELFVLDDGWFGKRNLDNCSLGDWYPNMEKLPGGITGLAKKVEEMGLKFGLWFEPEMTNKDSDLFRAHPDWLLADIRRNYCHSRNQYVLDFSKQEVVDYIYEQMRKVLTDAPVSYVKWDMNRAFSEVFSNGNGKSYQGKVRHKYILGVYSLYERLIQEFPEILFESCASGGARFDPGMLYYAPQAWTSDNTDAVDRIKIQYGTSYVYPISSIGSHVSASPNHQVFRNTSLETRANVAYFGTFGYELDITRLPEEELEQMKEQIQFMKENRALIQQGVFYRLKSPFEGNNSAWQVVSEDRSEGLVAYFRTLQPAQGKFERIYVKGLEENAKYEVKECFGSKADLGVHYGDELMYAGLNVSDCAAGIPGVAREQQGDYFSRLFYVKKIEE
ncbi:alpha-galactosidase [Sellimonas caecigallum]|uniref:Alpha-galactosidase n=1 Tax=Sellimonas caecigallum TaxID=2592333 RepID=A0ABS7L568_9FIRM|nr:alpha-galactosidase [Sellimonas caecigallum]MBY0758170.1 alpha-galactosidase [Sellimonas caecigallum]